MNKNFKVFVLFLAGFLVASLTSCNLFGAGIFRTQDYSKDNVSHVTIEAVTYDVEVVGVEGTTMDTTVEGDSLDTWKVTTGVSDWKLTIEHPFFGNSMIPGKISVRLPIGASVDVFNESGYIRYQNVHGSIRGYTVSGDILANNVGGTLNFETTSGAIKVQTWKTPASSVFQSVSGGVSIYSMDYVPYSVQTTSITGNIRISAPNPVDSSISPVNLNIKTVTGDIGLF